MLDHDPYLSRPPDPRPAGPRSHKPKNAPKRQPQRGLGVAQLEKLRLEEQSKQQDVVCLKSLDNHHHGCLHQQEIKFSHQLHLSHPHPLHEEHLQFQHHIPSLCSSSQMKFMELPPGLSESHFPHPSAQVLNLQNTFLSLAGMSNGGPPSPLPLLISTQQFGNENETPLPPPSQVQDFCSLGYTKFSSGDTITVPLMGHPSNLTRGAPSTASCSLIGGEMWWHNHHLGRAPVEENGFTSASACRGISEIEMQGPDQDLFSTSKNANAASEYLRGGPHGSLHLSMGKLLMQNDGGMSPFTCLRPGLVGVTDLHASQRPCLELPMIGDGVLTRELSSFQTISLRPTWLPADKVFNKKRPLECMQEVVAMAEASRGLDLNLRSNEIDMEISEPNTNMVLAVPFSIRGSSTHTFLERQSEKARFMDKACSEVCSLVTEGTDPDACINSDGFLSLSNMSIDVETSEEFLTLGPSYSSLQMLKNVRGDCNGSPLLIGSSEKASTHNQPQELLYEGQHFFIAPTPAENNKLMSALNDQRTSYLSASLQGNVEQTDSLSSSDKVTGLYKQSRDGELDLELTLSL